MLNFHNSKRTKLPQRSHTLNTNPIEIPGLFITKITDAYHTNSLLVLFIFIRCLNQIL
jgi:hypothetical protein